MTEEELEMFVTSFLDKHNKPEENSELNKSNKKEIICYGI